MILLEMIYGLRLKLNEGFLKFRRLENSEY